VSATGNRRTRTISDRPNEAPDTAGVVARPPLIYGGALAAGLLAKLLFPTAFLPRRVARVLGLPLLGAGLLLFLFSLRSMRRARTDVRTSKPTTSLVLEGPYRFTRNPIYLGFTLIYGGITSLANSLPPALLLPFVLIVMRRGVIERRSATWSVSSARSTSGTSHASGAGSELKRASGTEATAALRTVPAARPPLRSRLMDLQQGIGHSPDHRRCCRTEVRARTLADRS
jgi:protein-S-isoprenylcysteine O-methyltransferase Ste14